MRPGLPPVDGKSEKIESRRALAVRLTLAGSCEWQEAGLVRMQAKPVPVEALPQGTHHPLRVVLPFEADDEVIAVAARHSEKKRTCGSRFALSITSSSFERRNG
jgi:hypothetical protein